MSPPSPAVSADAKAALAWAHGARFFTTAARVDQLPTPGLPESAFVGRSNAGKSTAINTLAGHRRLAFASKTPGRTQHINLFHLGPPRQPDALWADLPGYGYAAVSRGDKRRWQQVMADYLEQRESLAGIVLMVDSRHGFTALDELLLAFIAPRVGDGRTGLLVLLTKADKLSRNERQAALAKAQATLGAHATDQSDIGITLFSALDGSGVADAALALRAWVQPSS